MMTACLVGEPRRQRGSRTDLFRVRDLRRVAATCDVCLGMAGELGR